MPCLSELYPGISFVVRARSDVNYYLMLDEYAGACVVFVDKIMPPNQDAQNERDKWNETMSFKRVECIAASSVVKTAAYSL
jgi:hypothetical protein